jgi:hypothetical protein
LFIKRSRQTLIKNLTILKEILNSNLCARGWWSWNYPRPC